ncbi:Endoglucanase cel12A [Cladobotryum mycophilum]|uniref:Endoglucanase cel12A n=1 Tax=Cladobotryum mycophilum TaxID=491253 RepID=A0ABR0SRL3_9HYPO
MKSFFALAGILPAVLSQTLCDQYSTISANGFTISNNLWGKDSGTGFGCITNDWITDSVAFHADWQWSGSPQNVKSFPNVQRDLPQKRLVSQIGSMPTGAVWNYTGNNLRADVAYDLFTAYDPNHPTYFGDFELMIWLGKFGNIGPIGSSQGTVNVGGQNWELFYGYNGAMQVYSFVAPNPIDNFNNDVKNFYNWLASNRGYPINNQYLLSYQFGTEPFSGDGNTFHVYYWRGDVN